MDGEIIPEITIVYAREDPPDHWEERCLHLSDEVVFWVPREPATMPAFTTNVEWGMWHDRGRAVFGAPPEAPKNRYLLHYAAASGVPTANDLAGTVAAALGRIRRERLVDWATLGMITEVLTGIC